LRSGGWLLGFRRVATGRIKQFQKGLEGMDTFIILVVVVTSLWVLFDAKAIGIKKGQITGLCNMGPWGWFAVCLLLWIIGFPAYLAMRNKYKKINQQIISA
jgi:hypothetical protein